MYKFHQLLILKYSRGILLIYTYTGHLSFSNWSVILYFLSVVFGFLDTVIHNILLCNCCQCCWMWLKNTFDQICLWKLQSSLSWQLTDTNFGIRNEKWIVNGWFCFFPPWLSKHCGATTKILIHRTLHWLHLARCSYLKLNFLSWEWRPVLWFTHLVLQGGHQKDVCWILLLPLWLLLKGSKLR